MQVALVESRRSRSNLYSPPQQIVWLLSMVLSISPQVIYTLQEYFTSALEASVGLYLGYSEQGGLSQLATGGWRCLYPLGRCLSVEHAVRIVTWKQQIERGRVASHGSSLQIYARWASYCAQGAQLAVCCTQGSSHIIFRFLSASLSFVLQTRTKPCSQC